MIDYAVSQAKEQLEKIMERIDLCDDVDIIDSYYFDLEEVYIILDSIGVEQDDISNRNYDKESYMKDQLILSDYEVIGDEILCPHYEEEDGELRGFISYLTRCGYRFTGLIPE